MRMQLNNAALHGRWQEARQILSPTRMPLAPVYGAWLGCCCLRKKAAALGMKLDLLERFKENAVGDALAAFAGFYAMATDKTLSEEQFRMFVRERLPSPQDDNFRTFFELLLLEEASTRWQTWETFELLEFLPLVDRYEFFIRLTATALASNHEDKYQNGSRGGPLKRFM